MSNAQDEAFARVKLVTQQAAPHWFNRAMGIPETIVAAGIGGAATVTAALFQLYTAMRIKSGQSPKKTTSALRSSFATLMLMIASAAGGYIYAELRQQRALDDARAMHEELRTMRDEINARLLVLAQTTERLAQDRAPDSNQQADVEHALAPDRGCDATSSDAPTLCEATTPPETSTATPLVDGVIL
jgi:hypothetical protein